MRTYLAIALLAMTFANPHASLAQGPHLVRVDRIWDAGAHNAFTDLARWRGRWYCVFREGDAHVGGDGRVRILVSDDGVAWSSAGLLEQAGVDLRDPKLSVTPDDALMIVMGGSVYEGTTLVGMRSRVAFSIDGTHWTPTSPVLDEGEWLWRVTWHEGVAYGVTYRPSPDRDWTIRLVSSTDGRSFTPVATTAGVAAGTPGLLRVPGKPSETTLRVRGDGTMIALLRRDGADRHAWLGTSRAPFADWTWTSLGHRVGGPNVVEAPGGELWAAGRSHLDGVTTVLATLTPDRRYTPVLTLPSGGDTSYPGLVWHDGDLWMSYYSSHDERTAIYLARIRP